ncbi:NAD-dependent epimerase/dehydratase family protein [Chloroflexota bacterium]
MSIKNLLIIGGSGFLSGTLARTAVAQGYNVWTITRGQRDIPTGVASLIADRHDHAAFAQIVTDTQTHWDMVIDCIAYTPADIKQDMAIFRELTPHLIFVSTDFVYDPAHRQFPQGEETEHYQTAGYGADKRLCELELTNSNTDDMAWTIVRPCHIYGPGSQLGCLQRHSRDPELITKLKRGERLQLVGGGHFLQQPILARDLSKLLLSLGGNENTYGQVFCAAGPDVIESREYYQIIANILGVGLEIEEISVKQHLADHPETAVFICHRFYDLSKLKASGAAVPSTPIEQGLREHVESLFV